MRISVSRVNLKNDLLLLLLKFKQKLSWAKYIFVSSCWGSRRRRAVFLECDIRSRI